MGGLSMVPMVFFPVYFVEPPFSSLSTVYIDNFSDKRIIPFLDSHQNYWPLGRSYPSLRGAGMDLQATAFRQAVPRVKLTVLALAMRLKLLCDRDPSPSWQKRMQDR